VPILAGVKMIPGIPTQTLFNPLENYPPGVLRSAVIQLPGSGDTLDIQFFPECQEIVFAMDNRTSNTLSLREERLKKWNCSRTTRRDDSWSLDEISSEKTKWKEGKLQVEWDRDKCEMLKDDIAKIEEILEWQERDLRDMELEADELLQRLPENEEMDEWVNTHTFTEEEEEFFEKEIMEMNLHHLRASSGPPTDEYLMNVSYDINTGLPDKNKRSGCWREEEWCPESGRLSLISLPEDYGVFSSFNKDFVEFGIQWPDHIKEKTGGECEDRRFSGLKSCGGWIEDEADNEGRFVANGLVQKVARGLEKGAVIRTEYGDCDLQHEEFVKFGLTEGEEIKILCKDNDILKDWAKPIKCLKVLLAGEGSCKEVAMYKM
jgi:hypothetical protein